MRAPSFVGNPGRWNELADVRVELATPMLGGGSRAGFPDLDQPFRPSAVRGALRRWWRATNVFADPAELRQRERALWGMADSEGPTSSLVRIFIDADSLKPGELVRINDAKLELPPYAKGILIKDKNTSEEDWLHVLPSGGFRLEVSVRSELDEGLDTEVRRALAAWLLFGGIGARTRRGFGALTWTGFDAQAHLGGLADTLNPAFVVSGFTSLVGARLFLKGSTNANPAWHEAIGTLRDFRRGQRGGQRPALGPDSHSPWPEADSIRQRQRVGPLRLLPTPTFPRAELGLPLQFRSARPGRQNGNRPVAGEFREEWVPTTTGKTRLASPVLVKPILWNGRWSAGFVLLSRGRLNCPCLTTDAKGYPDNVYGVPKYAGSIQQKNDILDVLNVMLEHPAFYGYTQVTLP